MTNHAIYIIIPLYNSKLTISFAVESALRQEGICRYVIIVDHGSNDGSLDYVKEQYGSNKDIHILSLTRSPDERRSASRPLNAGFRYGLELCKKKPMLSNWMIRLDADDVLYANDSISSALLHYSEGIKLINGRIIMLNESQKLGYQYSSKYQRASIRELVRGSVYSMAHHATLIASELVELILSQDAYCYPEDISYGEDLDFSIRLLTQCKEQQLRMIGQNILIKKLDGRTITNSIGTKCIIQDHMKIFKRHTTLSRLFLLNILLWFGLDACGRIGKAVNKKRRPPAFKYAEILPFPYVDAIETFERLK